jgi:hypothetical protein
MSAWSVGSSTGLRRHRAEARAASFEEGVVPAEAAADMPTAADAPTVDKLLAWLPGDVIAAYMAIVLALQEGTTVEPTDGVWLIGAIAAAGVVTFLAGFTNPLALDRGDWRELALKSVVLSPIAFALWSLVLPGSWWQSIDRIADNAGVVAIVAGLGAAAFGLLAQGLVAIVNPPGSGAGAAVPDTP